MRLVVDERTGRELLEVPASSDLGIALIRAFCGDEVAEIAEKLRREPQPTRKGVEIVEDAR